MELKKRNVGRKAGLGLFHFRILNVAFFLLLLALASPVTATGDDDKSMVTVVSYAADPGVMIKGDEGTIKVTIKNNAENPVNINRVRLYSEGIRVIDDTIYDSVGAIGPGNTRDFTFSVIADAKDGIYYPLFYADFSGSGSLRNPIPVKIDNSGLSVNVIDEPDYYIAGCEKSLTFQVGNPRESQVSGVTVTPVGSLFSENRGFFIGEIESDGSADAEVSIKPEYEGMMDFIIGYRNGVNRHEQIITLPVSFTPGSKAADPVLVNLKTSFDGSVYTLKGDVSNAGIDDAKNVVITAGEPAEPASPYKRYVAGSLKADDFSGFEINFRSVKTDVPVLISYRDSDGNIFEKIEIIDLTSAESQEGDDGSGSAIIYLFMIGLVVSGGAVYYWKFFREKDR
ncbi:MAG: hypothetical protein JW931_02145 [Methanomicrobiaceae archaeon]|nr:hypothetical protein [Methanomicrobiaceae archaeon]